MKDRLTTSEKVRIELSRRKMTQADLADKLDLDIMTINRRLSSNAWKITEIYYMQHNLGFDL